MKSLKLYIVFLIVLTSCNKQKQDVSSTISMTKIEIPNIKKNKNNINFKLENGVLFFKDKPFSGIVNEFYLNDNLKTTSQYFEGKRQGFYKGFFEKGNKSFQRFYTNGLKSKIHKGWYRNGSIMFEYHFNNQGVYNGEVKDWFINGQLQKHFNFVEGKEIGSQKMWNVNGKIKANFYTVNGERHGLIGLKKCVSVHKKENEKK